MFLAIRSVSLGLSHVATEHPCLPQFKHPTYDALLDDELPAILCWWIFSMFMIVMCVPVFRFPLNDFKLQGDLQIWRLQRTFLVLSLFDLGYMFGFSRLRCSWRFHHRYCYSYLPYTGLASLDYTPRDVGRCFLLSLSLDFVAPLLSKSNHLHFWQRREWLCHMKLSGESAPGLIGPWFSTCYVRFETCFRLICSIHWECEYWHPVDLWCDSIQNYCWWSPLWVEFGESHRIKSIWYFILPIYILVTLFWKLGWDILCDVGFVFHLSFSVIQRFILQCFQQVVNVVWDFDFPFVI